MTFEKKLAHVFNLNEDNWMRHANPWSVWTRYTVLPMLMLAFWSRNWIGWWCLIPVSGAIIWMFVNPVLYNKPKSTKNWASRSVLGERIYLEREHKPLPEIHQGPIYILLKIFSGFGFLIAIWSTIAYSIWGAFLGISITYLTKSWFLDRMVWLYEGIKNDQEEYQSWNY